MAHKDIIEMIDAYQSTALIYTAIKINLFDHMQVDKNEVELLASTLHVNPDRLLRLLRALSVIGICEELSNSSYCLTDLGKQLISSSNSNMRERAILAVEMHLPAWTGLYKSMNSNQTSFLQVFGMSPWQFRQENEQQNLVFNAWISKETEDVVNSILAMINLAGVTVVADIGGGGGVLLNAIVNAFPHVRGILFELGHVIENISDQSILNAVSLIRGDFFEKIEIKADLYLMKSVIHDWSDEDAIRILKNCRATMLKNARLILIERILPFPSKEDPYTVKLDIRMMAIHGGRERNLDAFRKLLYEADLELVEVLATNSGFYMLESKAV